MDALVRSRPSAVGAMVNSEHTRVDAIQRKMMVRDFRLGLVCRVWKAELMMARSGWMRMVDESGHERFEFFVSDFGEDELNLLVGWLQRKREREASDSSPR